MNYFIIIIVGVVVFISILYLLIFFDWNKPKNNNERKKLEELQSQKNLKNIDDIFQSQKKDLIYNQHFFSSKKVVITGDLKYFQNRNDLARMLWENGAIIEKMYNSSIDILIVGKSNIDSLKLKSAFYLNIKVISEEELLNYFPNFKPFIEETDLELKLN